MALQVSFDIEEYQNLTDISFIDDTGVYDASDNTGGYGTPNDDYSDVDTVEITFTFPDGTSNTIDSTDLSSWAPTSSDTDVDISISVASAGAKSEWPIGVYEIVYTVKDSGGSDLSSVTLKALFTAQAKICSLNLHSELCDCDDYDGIKQASHVHTLIRAAEVNFDEGSLDEAEDLIELALEKCESCNYCG